MNPFKRIWCAFSKRDKLRGEYRYPHEISLLQADNEKLLSDNEKLVIMIKEIQLTCKQYQKGWDTAKAKSKELRAKLKGINCVTQYASEAITIARNLEVARGCKLKTVNMADVDIGMRIVDEGVKLDRALAKIETPDFLDAVAGVPFKPKKP
jgi:hypothetical protein